MLKADEDWQCEIKGESENVYLENNDLQPIWISESSATKWLLYDM